MSGACGILVRDHLATTSLSSVSDAWDANVSPSHDELLSSIGLRDPEEIEEEDPMVHSSLLS